MSIGIFFTTEAGSTERVAEAIRDALGADQATLHNLAESSVDKLGEYTGIVFGAPTMGDGDLSDDWEGFIDNIKPEHVKGKPVAIFGLGDQDGYPDSFLDAMGTVYDRVTELGANVVGHWPTDGYEFDDSKAIRDGKFVGLGIDEDNQQDKTAERIDAWTKQIKDALTS